MTSHTKLLIGGFLVLVWPEAGPVRGGPLTTAYKARDVTIQGTDYRTTGKHVSTVDYEVNGVDWVAALKPTDPQPLKLGGTDNFLKVLKQMFPEKQGWSFVAGAKDLSDNSLIVGSYQVHATDLLGKPNFVGIEGGAFGTRNQGFDVQYKPAKDKNDPDKNVHWIQVIKDNHAFNKNLQGQIVVNKHGQDENRVDVPQGATTPYYDNFFTADGSNFLDTPSRADFGESHTWSADLYLVVGPDKPGQVTIYDGISWGWENHPTPEPSSAALLGIGALGLVAARWYGRRRAAESADFDTTRARA